jgi:hypothetical protein
MIIETINILFLFIDDHLYWSDALYDTIQRCDLDGSDCVTIVNGTGSWKIQRIRDIVTDGTNLYYAADNKEYVIASFIWVAISGAL